MSRARVIYTPPPAPGGDFDPGSPLFFDDFDYTVGRLEEGGENNTSGSAYTTFTNAGWQGVRRAPTDVEGTEIPAYLYTVSDAEMRATTGYAGAMPGGPSERCLKHEFVQPDSTHYGTDNWLQYGNGTTTTMPGNAWFQFWIYVNRSGDEMSSFESRQKFIYPANWTTTDQAWIVSLSANSFDGLAITASETNGQPVNTNGCYIVIGDGNATGKHNFQGEIKDEPGEDTRWLGPGPDGFVTPANALLPMNAWRLVKIHLDTTSNAGGAAFEAWMAPIGGPFVKVSEFIDGVTPDFTWQGFDSAYESGRPGVRLFTTAGWDTGIHDLEQFFYLKDFAIATAEGDLPTYGSNYEPMTAAGTFALSGNASLTAPGESGYTATHYVAPYASVSGASSDEDAQNATAYNNATSSAAPCTLACAMANAVAGNKVEVAEGLYVAVATNSNRYVPAWKPTNNGANGNPIVFFAKYPAPYNRSTPSSWSELSRPIADWWEYGNPAGTINPITGASQGDSNGVNYIVWDGFYINEEESRSGPSAGCVQTQGGSIGIEYRRFLFDRRNMTDYGTWTGLGTSYNGYNGNCFWTSGCDTVRIVDCYFWGNDFAAFPGNDTPIQTYGAHNLTVEYCTAYKAGGLVAFKAANNANTVARYNWVEMYVSSGGQSLHSQISENSVFHHNLVKGTSQLITYFNPADMTVSPVQSYNNTFILTGTTFDLALYIRGSRVSNGTDALYNTIVYVNGSGNAQFCEIDPQSPGVPIDEWDRYNYNVYYRADAGTPRWLDNGVAYTSFASYQQQMATYGTDPHGDVYESDSIYADPEFVDYDNDNFRLQAGSPALTAGVGGGAAGCYETGNEEIGIRAAPTY